MYPGATSIPWLLLLSLITGTNAQSTASSVYCTVASSSSGSPQSNQGLSYAYYTQNPYTNPETSSDGVTGYPAYDPTYWNTQVPFYIGQTSVIGFPLVQNTGQQYQFYSDSPAHTIPKVTLVHRAYLYASTSGTYTFTSTFVDDIDLTWVADLAYSGYTRANAALVHTYSVPSETARSYSLQLVAGQYLPFRVQYSNSDGTAGLTFTITNPAGAVLLNNVTSIDVVTQPCDGSANFPPFYNGPAYVTTTLQQTGTATTVVTQTVAAPSGTVSGTVDVFTPLPQSTATGIQTCAIASPTLSSDSTGNSGLQYGVWNSTVSDANPNNQQTGFTDYPVTSFDGTAAVHLGVTNKVGFSAGLAVTVQPLYSDTTLQYKSQFLTVIHRGYLFARTSGAYTITIPTSDEITLVWLGDTAVSGFTRANANLISVTVANQQSVSYTTTFTAGQYIPIRIQWANAQGSASLDLTVTNPSGNVLLSSSISNDFYYQVCPGQTSNGNPVPVFTPWFGNVTYYVTITTQNSITATNTITTTIAQPSGTNPGTVDVLTPAVYTTITGPYTGPGTISGTLTTTVAQPSDTTPGTVAILTPAVYNTITSLYTGTGTITGPLTTTVAQPSDTTPGTVVILTPAVYNTVTSPYTGPGTLGGPLTSTVASPSGTTPGTVVILTPAVYTTITSLYTGPGTISGPYTSTIAQPSGTAPGTVAILTPTSTRPSVLATMLGPDSCVCVPGNF